MTDAPDVPLGAPPATSALQARPSSDAVPPETRTAQGSPAVVPSAPNTLGGVLLWLFFGGTGAHRYYFGKNVSAAVHFGVFIVAVVIIAVAMDLANGTRSPNWPLFWTGFAIGELNVLTIFFDVLFIPGWVRLWTPPAVGPVLPTNVLSTIAVIEAFVIPVGGIIVGFISLAQIKRTGEAGHGRALAGVVVGFVLTAIYLIWFIATVVFLVDALNGPST